MAARTAEGARWRSVWDGATIVAGSWAVAASWGVAIGLLMGGGGPLFAVTTCGLFLAARRGLRGAAPRIGRVAALTRRVAPVALVAGVPCAIGAGAGHLGRTARRRGLAVLLAAGWFALGPKRYGLALLASALAIATVPAARRGEPPRRHRHR